MGGSSNGKETRLIRERSGFDSRSAHQKGEIKMKREDLSQEENKIIETLTKYGSIDVSNYTPDKSIYESLERKGLVTSSKTLHGRQFKVLLPA